jgi:hypothetical protein
MRAVLVDAKQRIADELRAEGIPGPPDVSR